RDGEQFNFWSSERRFRTGKVELNDSNYEQPNADLKSEGSAQYARSDLESYEYPGKFKERDVGDKYAKIGPQAEQVLDHRRLGGGSGISLLLGGLTRKKYQDSENQKFLIIRFPPAAPDFYRPAGGGVRHDDDAYEANYESPPSDPPFRIPIVTQKPR